MSAARLILLLLLVLVAVVLVVVLLRRGSARRDAQRVEAAHLRTEADTLAASVAGQSAFADQAAERAELARVEAEEKVREAARLEAEAAEHRATVEATQRDYEATMRRADDIDPDVKESQFPAVTESEGEHADAVDAVEGERGEVGEAEHGDAAEDRLPMTRSERREAREAGEPDGGAGWAAPAAPSSAPAAGAVGGAAAGASGWAETGDAEKGHESERIASAADFRDDVPAEQADVYAADDTGSASDMSENSSTETTDQHSTHDEGLVAGEAAATAAAGAGGAYAATRAMHDDDHADGSEGGSDTDVDAAERTDADAAERTDADAVDRTDAVGDGGDPAGRAHTDTGNTDSQNLSHDVESPKGEWGGPRQDEPAEMTIIGEPEAYATSEPVLAPDQAAPVSPETVDTDSEGTHTRGDSADEHVDADATGDHAPAEAGAAVAKTAGTDRSAADLAEEPTQERYDPTPTRDWASDEGELLEQNSDRGDRLEAERADLAREAGDATPGTASVDATAADGEAGTTAAPSRRISAFEELRDGGFGVGSAAPLDDGAQPLDHPVQAYRDTMTYRLPGDADYDSAQPHLWFYDEGAAQRSGFRHVEG